MKTLTKIVILSEAKDLCTLPEYIGPSLRSG